MSAKRNERITNMLLSSSFTLTVGLILLFVTFKTDLFKLDRESIKDELNRKADKTEVEKKVDKEFINAYIESHDERHSRESVSNEKFLEKIDEGFKMQTEALEKIFTEQNNAVNKRIDDLKEQIDKIK